jgi:hypothetical protein
LHLGEQFPGGNAGGRMPVLDPRCLFAKPAQNVVACGDTLFRRFALALGDGGTNPNIC